MEAKEGTKELDRGLMWLCFLPQALMGRPRRRGRSGRRAVARRFNILATERDWMGGAGQMVGAGCEGLQGGEKDERSETGEE